MNENSFLIIFLRFHGYDKELSILLSVLLRILQKSTTKIGGSLVGSIIGASAGICSCGPIGFSIISTFGTAAGTATAFLTNYEIPLRIISLGLLCLVYYTTAKSIAIECKIQ